MSFVKVDCSMKVLNYEELNDSFANATVAIAYTGKNRNGSFISKEAFLDAIPTLKNVPIVGHYNEDTKSFGEHDSYYEKDDDGDIKLVNMTIPFGVIPESANQWFEDIDIDGEKREMLVTKAIIWKRQNGFDKIKESGKLDQSMEIDCEDYSLRKDGYIDIKKFTFTALCILESAPPCFEGASVSMAYTLDDFKTQYSLMLNELKELGGKMKVKNKIEETLSENVKEEELVNEDFSEDKKETEQDFSEDKKDEDKKETEQKTFNEKMEKQFSSYKEKYKDLEGLVDTLNTAEDIDSPYFVMCDYDGSYVYMKDLYSYEEPKYFRIKYVTLKEVAGDTEQDTGYRFEGNPENIYKLFVTEDDFNSIKQAGAESVQAEFKEYVEKYPEEEFSALREYKASKEKEERIHGEEKIFSKFDEKLNKSEEYKNLKKNKDNYSLEELEHECLYIVGKFALNSYEKDEPEDKKDEPLSFSVVREEDSSNNNVDDYGGILKHFE